MFSTLESAWDKSARRGWSTIASLGFQALALSLLLLVPPLRTPGPPKPEWLEMPQLLPPAAGAPAPTGERRPAHSSNLSGTGLVPPSAIPRTIAMLNEAAVASAPDLNETGVIGAVDVRRRGVLNTIGNAEVPSPPPAPTPAQHPIRVSHWAEGNLIYRVQPVYPPLARQARIQGIVLLRAVISKGGTIENLAVISGHPMLVSSALAAVRQWRYRPYLLNSEPVEVETEITVKFLLTGD